jgi:hypothetical protein
VARIEGCAIGLAALWATVSGSWGAGPGVELRETARVGETSRVVATLQAQGLYRPAPAPGPGAKEAPKALALKVETRLDQVERVVRVDGRGRPVRGVRRVVQAASAVNGEVRPMAAMLRPEVALLVAERTPGGVEVVSPAGPLTRSELELVQGPGDPLELGGLLPERAVAVGDRWKIDAAVARALGDYDTLSSSTLEATLATLDDAVAVVRLRGDVRGSVLGGEGTIACSGSFTFDRKAARVSKLVLERAEVRSPGPVEAGLDLKSTLTVTRAAAPVPAALADEVVARLDLDKRDPRRALLRLAPPGGKYTLLHDRAWHIYWDDSRLTVLKRMEGGEVIAQCNLSAGPAAGKGRHQDLDQFRDDLRRSLGQRFAQFLGVGEVDGDPAGHFRYKVGVQGRQGDVGVVWYYYLIASPEGDQVVATFTLADTRVKAFGAEDERLIGSFRWEPAAAPAPAP